MLFGVSHWGHSYITLNPISRWRALRARSKLRSACGASSCAGLDKGRRAKQVTENIAAARGDGSGVFIYMFCPEFRF